MGQAPLPAIPRQHDLDALRAFAMLLGIALHASLSFGPRWGGPPHDMYPNLWFGTFCCIIHGFRLQLFFVVSGFFTMMLWRKRGALGLTKQRAVRILAPCLLGVYMLGPINAMVYPWADRVEREHQRQKVVAAAPAPAPDKAPADLRDDYHRFFRSARFNATILSQPTHLVSSPIFGHLWFLWFLCWLTPAFVAIAWLLRICRVPSLPGWLVSSPACLLWLVPFTLIPQWFFPQPSFGPDTCIGLLPLPHLLVYYWVFFAFGALYFNSNDATGRLGRWWWLALPLALFVLYPVARVWVNDRMVTGVTQVLYTWLMIFGMMGLFRAVLKREYGWVRYLSDASYWLYLGHLPLVVAAQVLVQDWPLPAIVKFVLICVVVTGVLLIIYDKLVRYTDVGAMLNGRKTRPQPKAAAPAVAAMV